MKHAVVALTASALIGGLAARASAYEVVPVENGGAIRGTVQYTAAPPPAPKLEITKDADYCGKEPLAGEQIQVSAGKGLRNVVVFFEQIEKGRAAPPGTATLANRKCRYEPHVQALAVGTQLSITNEDPVLHNTHIRLPDSDVANTALPRQGQVVKQKLRRKGLMKVGCDAGHTWMSAWLAVFDHPYFAVTGEDGTFALDGIPPGDYNLVFWHEKLGKKAQKVTVGAGGTVPVSVQWP